MINRKLCIVLCCLGVGLALVAQAQPAPGASDDQAKALEALRQAEKGRLMATNAPPAAIPASNPVASNPVSDAETVQALQALRQAERGGLPAATPTTPAAAAAAPVAASPAPAPAPAATPVAQEDARALEALRQAERGKPASNPGNAAAPVPEQIKQQEEADVARERKALADREAAARATREANERSLVAINKHEDADTVAATAALEQYESNNPLSPEDADKRAAAAAVDRQKAQEDVARRVENLQKDIKLQGATAAQPAVSDAAVSKEARLRDLLRRYNADEITPLEYHTERAKIVAEP